MRRVPPALKPLQALLAVVATLVVAAAAAPLAYAHDDALRLVVEPTTTSPGGSVTVRGDLPTTSDLDLLLVEPSGRELSVGHVADPPNGHFEAVVTVPVTAVSGTWTIEATVRSEHLAGASLVVEAAPAPAVDDQGAPEQNGQDEPVAAAPVVRPTALPAATRAADASGSPLLIWVIAIGTAIVASLGATMSVKRHRARLNRADRST